MAPTNNVMENMKNGKRNKINELKNLCFFVNYEENLCPFINFWIIFIFIIKNKQIKSSR